MKRLLPIIILCLILGIAIGAVSPRLTRSASERVVPPGTVLRPTYLFNLPPERAEALITSLWMQPGTRASGGEMIGETQIGYVVAHAASCEESEDIAAFLESFLQSYRFQCIMMLWSI